MGFTTHLEMHSQASRLEGRTPSGARAQGHGAITLHGARFLSDFPMHTRLGIAPTDYNSRGILSLGFSRFTRRY